MAVKLNLDPGDRQLRQFAVTCLIAFPLVTWLWTRQMPPTGWAAAVGLTVGGVGIWKPALVRPIFVVLSLVTFPIGLVVGELAMLLVFLLAFVPLAIVFRLIGRDRLQRRGRTVESKSFWQERPATTKIESYFRQF